MFDKSKRKYLFKCQDCAMILSVEFDDKEDLQKVDDDEMVLQCPCEGDCLILRD